ncbi:hypothetical protein ADK60_04130 [Streptomyces sp. XY431]|uniref:hypothetical protein n=1 Tax=Streptomyces sp. XY431 TaxID=1415562 RepID=UPI0006AFD7F5|nr:hypothetical protein [Streptomyces sp. XY431]KOV37478.1 hypothetical protein ADK60_04130 [Streptomyces sp. XY431]
MPHRVPRPSRRSAPLSAVPLPASPLLAAPLLAGALLLAAGCAAPAGGSADRAAAPARELSAAELRAAAVTDAELGPGFTVTVIAPGHGETGPDGGRETADKPVCQPLLDAVAPAAGPAKAARASASPAPVSAVPYAETDLSVALAADPSGSLYGGLLGYRGDRAARLQAELEGLFGPCAEFGSTAPPPPADRSRGVTRTGHRLSRNDTPTPEGADAATGFTLTNESGAVVLAQRAVLARVGPALVVFSTVGVGAEPAPVPDERVVRHQVAKLRAAQKARES